MKVIVALDDSPYAQHVVELIGRRHWPQDTEFKLLHVIEPLVIDDWAEEDWPEMAQELERRRQKHAEKICADARHRIEKHIPDARVHFEIRHGNPKTQIVLAATDWEANRILIGAHGRGVCPHNLLGSVSRSVAEHSPCSVEIIRPKVHSAEKGESEECQTETVKSR